MRSAEAWRWAGSIGTFYVLIPAALLASEPFYAALVPGLAAGRPTAWTKAVAAAAALAGAWLVIASIRAQVTAGRGHPFDLTGRERLSRPTQVLLTSGVYAWTRNPMGLGDVLLYAALCEATGSRHSLLINVPLYAAVVVVNHLVNEAPRLRRDFGAVYEEYARTTSVLVPGWRTLRRLVGHGGARAAS